MELQQMDLNLLHYLEVLLDERHVGRAAKRLSLTQPALSNALRRLRDALGDDLLVRSGSSMVLSPFAKTIQTPLKQSLQTLKENILTKRTFDPTKDIFRFVTAFHGYEELILFSRLVQDFRRFQGLSLFNSLPKSMHIVDELAQGKVHFTTTPLTTERSSIMRCKILGDRFVCVVHNESRVTALDLNSYCEQNHLLITPHGGPGFLDEALSQIGRTRYIKATVGEFSSAPFVLERDSSLLTTVPERLAKIWLTRFPFRLLPCPVKIKPLTIYLSWHANMQNSPQMIWFKDQCLRLALKAA